jgi:hypothetical protein
MDCLTFSMLNELIYESQPTQMAEFDVPLRREREVVGHTRLRVTFDFRLEQRVEKFKPGSVKKTPLRHSDSMSAVSSISHHAGDSDTFQVGHKPLSLERERERESFLPVFRECF